MVQQQRVETVTRRAPAGPKPQWQDLFVAPAYPEGFLDEVQDEVTVPSPAGRRGDRRVA